MTMLDTATGESIKVFIDDNGNGYLAIHEQQVDAIKTLLDGCGYSYSLDIASTPTHLLLGRDTDPKAVQALLDKTE